ncbi:MAG: nicotinate-nucleotide--dimethylbenzimidazole phosphoribosyltransferase, partial [Burkholderiales bacterium PBB5]
MGSEESAALVLSRLTATPAHELLNRGPQGDAHQLAHVLQLAQAAQARHREVTDPVEVLAAFGGVETAVMVGAMLVAASKRHLIMVDGMAACAALLVAARIAESVTDYCLFCRSTSHAGLDKALSLFQASALLQLGLEAADGTGASLSLPLVASAAALLTGLADDEGPS